MIRRAPPTLITFLLLVAIASALDGDVNSDNVVDIFDLVIVAQNFGMTSGFDPAADLNSDGEIDIYDLVMIAQNFGNEGNGGSQDGLETVGVFAGYRAQVFPISNVDFDAITTVADFTLMPNTDGTISYQYITDQTMANVVQTVHNAGRKCLLSVGAWGAGPGFAGAAKDSTRTFFIKNMIDDMVQHGYDGIVIDWEEQAKNNIPNYQALIRELRAELDTRAPGSQLDVAVDMHLVPASMLTPIKDDIDNIYVMSFWEPPRSPNMETQVKHYIDAGFPASMVFGGVGLGDDGGIDTTPERVRAKMELAKSLGLGGVDMWKLDDGYGTQAYEGIMDVYKEYVYPR